jgi:hypothetical protein
MPPKKKRGRHVDIDEYIPPTSQVPPSSTQERHTYYESRGPAVHYRISVPASPPTNLHSSPADLGDNINQDYPSDDFSVEDVDEGQEDEICALEVLGFGDIGDISNQPNLVEQSDHRKKRRRTQAVGFPRTSDFNLPRLTCFL